MARKITRKELDKELRCIEDIRFILCPSSWGALSCIIEWEGGQKKEQVWWGTPTDEVNLSSLISALKFAIEGKLFKEEK